MCPFSLVLVNKRNSQDCFIYFFDSISFTLKIRPKRASFMIEGFWRTGHLVPYVHRRKNTLILSPDEQKRQINGIRKVPFTGVPVRVFLRENIW